MLQLWPADESVAVEEDGLVLREWTRGDVPDLVRLFDTPEMDRRTPLASPFDAAAAQLYVQAAHDVRRRLGALQLAVTQDGRQPLGEVIIFPTETEGTVELAYGVGEQHAGRGVARRAVGIVLRLASAGSVTRARLHIAVDNRPSQQVARATGFHELALPLVERRRKGQVVNLAVWERTLQSACGLATGREPLGPTS